MAAAIARCTMSFTRASVCTGPNSRHQYARKAMSEPSVKLPSVRMKYPPAPSIAMFEKNPTTRVTGKKRYRALIALICWS